jgi:hypothetical protein
VIYFDSIWGTDFGGSPDFSPKRRQIFFTAGQSGGNFEKFIFMKMEVVSLTDLFLNLWKVLCSHIQNLGSLITVDFSEWEIVSKSPVV